LEWHTGLYVWRLLLVSLSGLILANVLKNSD
jgi:hypothetical protein